MRRLTNNWLYGAVSPLLSGRLDSDIYGNSCSELLNMKAHRQGGISRRPPLKSKIAVGAYKRIIPFIVDKTHVYGVLLGAGIVDVYDYLNNSLVGGLSLPTHEVASHSWQNITAAQCSEVKYAQYYNDLYLVHPSFPLMRIRYSGGFVISKPQVFVNQDIKPQAITLTLTMGSTSTAENITFTFDGIIHSFSFGPSTSVASLITNIMSFSYEGWELSDTGNTITFTPKSTIDKYVKYDINDQNYFGFKVTGGTQPTTFSYSFAFTDLPEDDIGIVYGSDDFPDCYLNRINDLGVYEFASDIAIVAEKMFLTVNGNPCNVYASRPYGTSQIVYPKRSNDSILDFVQFELVSTENTVMKEEGDLLVEIVKDTNNDIVYEGVSTDQKLWFTPAENQITTKKSLDEYRKGRYENGAYVANSAHEFVVVYEEGSPNIVKKLRKITTTETTEVDYIERTQVYYLTYDTEVQTSKLTYNNATHQYGNDTYYIYSNSSYTKATISEAGTGGLKNVYTKTTDNYINPKAAYYTRSGSEGSYTYTYVSSPTVADIPNYYEKTVEFTDKTNIPIYEYGYQYVYSGTTNQLRAKYLDNGMIGSLSYEDVEVVKAIPYYQYKMDTESEIYEQSIEVDKVATASTGMEFQLSSGRNDRIAWMKLGDYLMIGTESAEWRMNSNINALNSEADMYSSYGSNNGLSVNLGPDIIFLQRGNGLRLLYKDYHGLQNVELTLTNPDIMEGTIKEMSCMVTPEPALFALKSTGNIVTLCIDRTNGVQAFAEWTFGSDKPVSICVLENDSRQVLVALMSNGTNTYIAEFDNTETLHFKDCGYTYVLTQDTTIASGKTYYSKSGNTYSVATPVSNPKAEGLYEYGLFDEVFDYVSRMVANPFDAVMQDGSVTIGEAKNVSKMIFRCLDTGYLITYFNIKDKTRTRVPICCDGSGIYIGGLADHSVNVNGGTTRDLLITVESYEDNPITLLAMAYELRLNKNGIQ